MQGLTSGLLSQVKYMRKSGGLKQFAPVADLSAISKFEASKNYDVSGGQVLGDEWSEYVIRVSILKPWTGLLLIRMIEPKRHHLTRGNIAQVRPVEVGICHGFRHSRCYQFPQHIGDERVLPWCAALAPMERRVLT